MINMEEVKTWGQDLWNSIEEGTTSMFGDGNATGTYKSRRSADPVEVDFSGYQKKVPIEDVQVAQAGFLPSRTSRDTNQDGYFYGQPIKEEIVYPTVKTPEEINAEHAATDTGKSWWDEQMDFKPQQTSAEQAEMINKIRAEKGLPLVDPTDVSGLTRREGNTNRPTQIQSVSTNGVGSSDMPDALKPALLQNDGSVTPPPTEDKKGALRVADKVPPSNTGQSAVVEPKQLPPEQEVVPVVSETNPPHGFNAGEISAKWGTPAQQFRDEVIAEADAKSAEWEKGLDSRMNAELKNREANLDKGKYSLPSYEINSAANWFTDNVGAAVEGIGGFLSDPTVQKMLLLGVTAYAADKAGAFDSTENTLKLLGGAYEGFMTHQNKENSIKMVDKFGEFILEEDLPAFREALKTNDHNVIRSLGIRGLKVKSSPDYVDPNEPEPKAEWEVQGSAAGGYFQHNKYTGEIKPLTEAQRKAMGLKDTSGTEGEWNLVPQVMTKDGKTGHFETDGKGNYRYVGEGKETTDEKAKGSSTQATLTMFNDLETTIDEVLNDENLPDVLGASEGDSEATDWKHYFDEAEVDLINKIQSLSDQSQLMGKQKIGAVGSVTEREWPKLAAAIARLNRTQSPEQFKKELTRFKGMISSMREDTRGGLGSPVFTNTGRPDGEDTYNGRAVIFRNGHMYYK